MIKKKTVKVKIKVNIYFSFISKNMYLFINVIENGCCFESIFQIVFYYS